MKIEKMNDHQIRCTLTREDLAMRHIKLSELAYGTENAKSLFRDMMQQAANDFGFEAEDIPLMIEAIPLSADKIVLIITKVESPDELDTRFSNFTHPEDEEYEDGDVITDESEDYDSEDMSSDILELFERIKEERSASAAPVSPTADATGSLADARLTRLFTFDKLEDAIQAAHALDGFYQGRNTLFKDPKTGSYYLVLKQSKHTVSDFNRINNAVSAYLKPLKFTLSMQAFFEEHYTTIIPGNALQSLAEI